jgi:hypothetical protein
MAEQANAAPVAEAAPSQEVLSEANQEQSSQQAAPVGEAKAIDQLQKANPELSKKEAKKMIKQLQIKFNGKEYTEELPFEIEDTPENVDYMRKQAQMSRLAQSSSQERAQLEKDVRNFVDELRKNPKKLLADPTIGIDLKRLAKEIIEEEIENSQKSPEQLEKEKLQAELKAIKEERENEKKEALERNKSRLESEAIERYDVLMSQALEKSTLPKSPYVIKKMASLLELGLREGLDVTPEDVMPLVEDEIRNDVKDMFATMPDEVFEAFIGRERINNIRKKNIAKAKQAAQVTQAAKVQDTGAKKSEAKADAKDEKVSFKQFFGI